MRSSSPALALLLDVDGPIASPISRTVKPEIIGHLSALAAAGVPVLFNTGRSDAFIREQVMEPMLASGMPDGTVVHAICEKGAVWFSFTAGGPGPLHVDSDLAVPEAFGTDVRTLVAQKYAAHMFFDETKLAMVSVEQHLNVPSPDYLAEQRHFDDDVAALMKRHGLDVIRLDRHAPDQPETGTTNPAAFRVDPTIISTDIESIQLGKDLGASRAVELLAKQAITPLSWRTVGDSRTDYAMADWLHHHGHEVKHVDVRPADGVPQKPYPVLTASDLGLGTDVIHDVAGAAFLSEWLRRLTTD